MQTWIWQDLSTFRVVRVETFCVLYSHFDLEGARHVNLENKHDLVIKSQYKTMFALKITFTFVLQHICVFFTPEPFMSTHSVQQANRCEWAELGLLQFPLCSRSWHCHAALMCEHLHLLGKARPAAPGAAPSSCTPAFYHRNKNDNDSRKWPFSLELS